MTIPLTLNHEIQKMLKDRGLWTGEIDGKLDIIGVEHLMFQLGINYAGWTNERKMIAAEELFYETQGIDIGVVDGLDDHYIQHAREVYKAKLAATWRDKVEEIARENAPPDTSGSEWAAKYTLTQKALGITAKQYDAYREAVGLIESRNNPNQGAGGAGGHYYGMYQFGTAATQTTSAFLKDSISKEDFEGNQDLAEKHFDALSYINHKTLSKTEEYVNLTATEKLAVLGYAHNQGAGGARNWLQSGVEGKDAFGTSGKKYYDAILASIKKPNKIEKTSDTTTKESKQVSLRDINIHQLKFIRGIGETETGFSKKEAYSETYNRKDNNRNVREYGQKGADYGYYQCNEFDVEHAIKLGVNKDIAKHLNGCGKGGKSSVAEQTIAIHEYLCRAYKNVYEKLKSGSTDAWQEAIDAMDSKWFGLKDRPQDSKKIWLADWTIEKLWPEVSFTSSSPKIVKVESTPKKTYSWPRQSSAKDFYGEVGTSQVKCQLPFTMVLAWDTGTKLTSYSCHKLVKEPMERIWNRVYEHYGYDKIVDLRLHMFGGCLNVRKMRGGSSWSMHSWGAAVDIDPERNALHMNKSQATLSKPIYDKYWEFIYDEGAIGLGPERDFDWMHFQFMKL